MNNRLRILTVTTLVALLLLATGSSAVAQDDEEVQPAFRGITAGFAESPIRDISPYGVNELAKEVRRGIITVRAIGIEDGKPGSNAGGGGVGSGFVIDNQGHAITNYHVAGKAGAVKVTLWDDTDLPARLIEAESGIDSALIKIEPPQGKDQEWLRKKLQPVPLGDSDQLALGQSVVTFGNPGWADARLGFGSNVSEIADNWFLKQTINIGEVAGRVQELYFQMGIYTWYQRNGQMGFQYGTNLVRPIRMSAAINGGNSGGPLITAEGAIVGINSWGGGGPGIAENSNTAVPINQAKEFAFEVIETGSYKRPWLGLDVVAPEQYLSTFRYAEFVEQQRPDDRLPIYGVRTESPADDAGLQRGDIIVTIDGLNFPDPESVRAYVLSREVGEELEFKVRRDGETRTITVATGPKPTYNSDFSV